MISWKRVSDQMPPLEKKIVIAIPSGHNKDKTIFFRVYIATVEHPFKRDNKFNPDYFTIHSAANYGPSEPEKLQSNHYWCLLNQPEEASEE